MMTDDTAMQQDEISAISAIFGDDWVCENQDDRVYSIELKEESSSAENCDNCIRLGLKLPEEYPSKKPPVYEISAPWMSRKVKSQMMSALDQIYDENRGESIIYQWIEKAREYLFSDNIDDSKDSLVDLETTSDQDTLQEESLTELDPCPEVIHGEPLTDRRSAFQAHLAKVSSVQQVKQIVEVLKSNKKVATATHNIVAYRILTPKNAILQDCDDDGETHAGSRLLHLMQILDVQNVVVVVSRWFGGIQLGPDRFKHINNVARDILDKSGMVPLVRKSNKKPK